jgi:exo-1,4-beta-D-glucosaminidase
MRLPPVRLHSRAWPLGAPLLLLVAAFVFAAAPLDAQESTALREGWKVQSSSVATAPAEEISRLGFATTGWYKTAAPKTVFAVLVENGVYKDPYFGMNLRSVPGVEYKIGAQFANEEMPADSPYAVPWWYRKEFSVPESDKGKTIWLAFRGINYRAEIWINGKKLAGQDEVAGAFRRYEFDVTSFVHPGKQNVVAVKVSAPRAGELGITWVDWNPTPPDKDMGLWQEVVLSSSGPVAIRHPFVESHLDLPAAEAAHLTVRAELRNSSNHPVEGTLHGRITGEPHAAEFSERVQLAAGETREVTIAPDTQSALNFKHPRLWWPYQMGEPYLHTLSLRFVMDHGGVSDTQSQAFGIVQFDSEMTPEGAKLFKVNGKPVLIRGGGWAPDMMLRVDESRRAAEFRYVREMGLNTIRLEGKLEDESFFDRADRDGILVMAGWCCCDAWEKWSAWGDENRRVSVNSLRDQVLRLRAHPSVFVWLNGSDNPPPSEREQAYLAVEKETHWPRPLLSSASAKKAEFSGESGVKMTGPYDYVSPNYWLLDAKAGGAWGFNTETSPGPAVPPLEELESMFPQEKLWPINEVWDFHAGGGEFKDIQLFTRALDARYGQARSAADFSWKSQAMTYEGERAMFEAYGRNKYKSTGVIQWMLNNAWPGLIWHLYDYSLRPAGGYFGAKKALEPLHAQFSYDDRGVAVVNSTQTPAKALKLSARVYDMAMREVFSREESLDVAADGVTRSFAIPEPAGVSTAYFLELKLRSASGEMLSRNFYWLSTKPDVLDFSKTEWYYTPLTSYADLTVLQSLPTAAVKARVRFATKGEETSARVTLENTGASLAFLVRLRVLKGAGGHEALPVYWSDNYVSLLPGEKEDLTVEVPRHALGGTAPVLAIDGFNVSPQTVR